MNKNDVGTLYNLPIRNHSSEVSKYFMIGLVYQNRTITFAHRIFDSLQSVGIPLKFFSYHCVNSDVLIWENWGIFFFMLIQANTLVAYTPQMMQTYNTSFRRQLYEHLSKKCLQTDNTLLLDRAFSARLWKSPTTLRENSKRTY